MLVKGTAYEDLFHYSDNPTMKKIWTGRIKPYLNDAKYPTVGAKKDYLKTMTTTCKSNSRKTLSLLNLYVLIKDQNSVYIATSYSIYFRKSLIYPND